MGKVELVGAETPIPEAMDIDDIEKKMLQYEQAECPVVHTFGPGLYIREVRIPVGAIAIGHHQKTQHMNIFLKGRLLIVNQDGTRSEITAPMMFTGNPGRKTGYVLEEVVWLNVYNTDVRDVDTLEKIYLEKSDGWNECQSPGIKRIADNTDYDLALKDIGVTEDIVRSQSENEEDQIPFPFGSYKIGIFDSQIEGKGVFATANIDEGEMIAPALIGKKRTPAGRYTNHSPDPNARMIYIDNEIHLIAISKINGCTGGMVGEEVTTDYRQTINLIRSRSCLE